MNGSRVRAHAAFSITAALVLLSTAAPRADGIHASCRATRTGGCECSISSVELPMSFGDAAGTIVLYYRDRPDALYEAMLVDLVRECVAPWASQSQQNARTARAAAIAQ